MSTPAAQCECAIHLEPDASAWLGLLIDPNTSEAAIRFREQLGLSTTKPIVMSGHQAQLWHPGILAKLFAAGTLAEQAGAEFVWLVVDTDTNDALSMRVPVRTGNGPMHDVTLDFVPPVKRGVTKPTGFTDAVTPADLSFADGARPATKEIAARLEAIHAALAAHSGEASAAKQVTRAMFDLLDGLVTIPKIVYASEIADTELFDTVRAMAADDPGGFAGSFNDAVEQTPGSGVAQLSIPNEELPMWRIDDRGRRQRARAGDARGTEPLLPGGMLMTGMMRLAGCDLFIHGTGGRDYEPINDAWLALIMNAELAPFTTASATLLLEFDNQGVVSQHEARQSRWHAHHAKHEPALLGEDELQQTKREFVAEIQSLPRRSAERNAKYHELQRMLEGMRQTHAEDLSQLRDSADKLEQRAAEYRLRTDRTWSTALHSKERLTQLGRSIADEFIA